MANDQSSEKFANGECLRRREKTCLNRQVVALGTKGELVEGYVQVTDWDVRMAAILACASVDARREIMSFSRRLAEDPRRDAARPGGPDRTAAAASPDAS